MRFLILAFFFLSVPLGVDRSFSQGIVTFGPHEAKIDGAIPYSVIGKYKAQFKAFKGTITLDGQSQHVQSVYLEIKVNSITSNCPWCDNIVKSQKLLNPGRYPKIIFKSFRIIHDRGGYKVKGILQMHGVKRVEIFPFNVKIIQGKEGTLLALQGLWVINRKDFRVIWNKLLDHGGILVGDHMTVTWEIQTKLNRRR